MVHLSIALPAQGCDNNSANDFTSSEYQIVYFWSFTYASHYAFRVSTSLGTADATILGIQHKLCMIEAGKPTGSLAGNRDS